MIKIHVGTFSLQLYLLIEKLNKQNINTTVTSESEGSYSYLCAL